MAKIVKLSGGTVDVTNLLWELQSHPQLWNVNTRRTQAKDSPHREVDDIWVRYAADDNVNGPHESVWYQGVDALPSVRDIINILMFRVRGERLGGVLITRIPAGKQVYPHADNWWHADYYDKFAVQIQSAPGQFFCFEGESLETKPGEIYWFDNSVPHWVTNDTPYDRITLIVCIRR